MAPAQMTFRPPTLHHINLKTSHLNEMIDRRRHPPEGTRR